MKLLLLAIIVCMIATISVGRHITIAGVKYIANTDTTPPGMQPVPPSTVNGNNTPVLPLDTGKHNMVDTFHTVH
jgi:hypothetical protein